ncbi:alpha/beta fold hydrolase [Ekhidna sp.]|uniref:S9 family peptidase n=1 Tax=Ekhidna sp. TaxID=2608089 RepID=UPI003C7C405F
MMRFTVYLIFFALCSLFIQIEAQPFRYITPLVPPIPSHLTGDPPSGRVLGPGLFNHIPPIQEVFHPPSATYAGHTPDGQLYIRSSAANEPTIISKPQQDWRWDIASALWSPDGQTLLVKQVDDREVPRIELKKADTTIQWPYSRAGEPLPKIRYYFVNVATGAYSAIQQPTDRVYVHPLSWHPDGMHVRIAVADRLMKNMELLRVYPENGRTEVWLSDRSETYLIGLELLNGYTGRLRKANFFYFLDATNQVIYNSERTGYNQLYLYDERGELVRTLTNRESNGPVAWLYMVDETNGWAYYMARGDKDNPYEEQLYRTAMDGSRIERLVEGPTLMEVYLTDTKDSLWVWRNDMERSATLEIYSAAGEKLATSWSADMSPLQELGLQPEFVQLKAADGKTMIETLVYKPKDLDTSKRYPVVEWIYGAAHTMAIRRNLYFPGHFELQNLANTGFIVVVIDGRGTPGRGKAFQEFSYGRLGQVEMADHVAALNALADERSYMDLDRLGVAGHSWGGHYALRAVLEYPDLYVAAYLSAAAIDPANFRVAIEPYMGCLPQDCPEKYAASALTPLLDRLQARLMINHGTADDDVPFADAKFLVDKLEELGYTDYEFVKYPGMDHIIMMNPQWEPRMIEFFKQELGASEK